MVSWTLVAHIFGFAIWIAGLLMATIVMARYSAESFVEAKPTLARMGRISLRALADPGAFLTLLAGIILITTNSHYYLHARWFQIKLVFVAMLIGVHAMVAMENKSLVSGRGNPSRRQARLLFFAVLLVFVLILISTLPGEVFFT